MTNRENALAVLRGASFEKVPVVHFGFWPETVAKWHAEGRLSDEEVAGFDYGSPAEERVAARLGFDFGWDPVVHGNAGLHPAFERLVLEVLPDGHEKVRTKNGAIAIEKPGLVSISAEIDHLLKDRANWDGDFRSRLHFAEGRVDRAGIDRVRRGGAGDQPIGLHCGSLYGQIRDMLGVENLCYLAVDDEVLYLEIIDTIGELCLDLVDATLAAAPDVTFDYGHFWEDICFKNGPLVSPVVFAEAIGPWYRKIVSSLAGRGVDLVSVDCDGLIDVLLPVWLDHGVKVMFPIEVGTWEASIAPWRKLYGPAIKGVGGMDKRVFSRDRAAVDGEIERLQRLVELGGYLPCPDHRIAPDALWDNVVYYCERFRSAFS